jgi:ABC-2 type transport system ATP-binding protein
MLTIANVVKAYGDITALNDVSLSLEAGSITVLVGRNGAGKTTLMTICAGLRSPDDGTVLIDGSPVEPRRWPARGGLGYAPQEIALYPPLTVHENLRFVCDLLGVRHTATAIPRVVDEFSLGECLDRPVARLSGGEQRRVHVATALVHDPAVILLDEPTAGVDPETRSRVLAAVRDRAAGGAAVLYSTHYLAEVGQLPGSVAVIERGRIVAAGSEEQLIAQCGDATIVEVELSRPPRALPVQWTAHERSARCVTDRPADAVKHLLSQPDENVQVTAIRFIEPGIDAAFAHLVGDPRLVASNGTAARRKTEATR